MTFQKEIKEMSTVDRWTAICLEFVTEPEQDSVHWDYMTSMLTVGPA